MINFLASRRYNMIDLATVSICIGLGPEWITLGVFILGFMLSTILESAR
jgi:hypothetical protein